MATLNAATRGTEGVYHPRQQLPSAASAGVLLYPLRGLAVADGLGGPYPVKFGDTASGTPPMAV